MGRRWRNRTFDEAGEEVLRLAFAPAEVTAGGAPLRDGAAGPGYSYDAKTGVLRVRRVGARDVARRGAGR